MVRVVRVVGGVWRDSLPPGGAAGEHPTEKGGPLLPVVFDSEQSAAREMAAKTARNQTVESIPDTNIPHQTQIQLQQLTFHLIA